MTQPASTPAPATRAHRRIREGRRWTAGGFGLCPMLSIALLQGCGGRQQEIPAESGPLTLDIRYPTSSPVAVKDSVSVWGTTGNGRARLQINGHPVRVERNGTFATFVPLPDDDPTLRLEALLDDSIITRAITVVRASEASPAPLSIRPESGWVVMRRLPDDTLDSATQARPIYSRWLPGGPLAVPLPQGIRLPVTAGTEEAVRLRLARGTEVWVPRADVKPVAPGELQVLGAPRLAQRPDRSRIDVAVGERLPVYVEVAGTQLRWTLFGSVARQSTRIQSRDGLVRDVRVTDGGDGRVVIHASLAEAPLGWRTVWHGTGLTLELRPRPSAARGLDGLVVAVDAGHPPGGSTGPGGLKEDSLTLAVALRVAEQLRSLGASPLLTREGAAAVSLDQRLGLAEAADAHLFVSIHVNAPGDGRPPESVDGTRAYWQDPRDQPLAKLLRDSVAASMRQVAAGTFQSDLAVLRATWFATALVEGTALVLPAREAYLRSPEGVAAYANGVVAAIQAWGRTFGSGAR